LRRLRDQEHGYTMIELLVTMTIMGVILGSLTTIFVSGATAEGDMNVRFQAQQHARLALDRVRRDVHLAGCLTLGTGGTAITLTTTTGTCPGTTFAYYCVTTSPSLTGRYALYRGTAVAGTCNVGTTLIADYLTIQNNVFGYTASTAQQLQKLTVDFPVDVSSNLTGGTYELKDDVVLRNSARS
jgi:prepilin-type N-terminal cleavage/methylation domain-containing protein